MRTHTHKHKHKHTCGSRDWAGQEVHQFRRWSDGSPLLSTLFLNWISDYNNRTIYNIQAEENREYVCVCVCVCLCVCVRPTMYDAQDDLYNPFCHRAQLRLMCIHYVSVGFLSVCVLRHSPCSGQLTLIGLSPFCSFKPFTLTPKFHWKLLPLQLQNWYDDDLLIKKGDYNIWGKKSTYIRSSLQTGSVPLTWLLWVFTYSVQCDFQIITFWELCCRYRPL